MIKNTYTKGENIVNIKIKDITVETASFGTQYDGQKWTATQLGIISGELNTGDKLTYDKTKPVPSITNVGSITNDLTPKIVDSTTGEDHTANYNITVKYGTLNIFIRPVTLVSDSNSKTYNQTYLTAPNVIVSGAGFVNGEVNNIKATGKIKNVGSCENTITFDRGKNFNPDNYKIDYSIGKLTIIPCVITLLSETAYNIIYDGTYHSFPRAWVEGRTNVGKGYDIISVKSTGEFRDVGNYENKPIVIEWAEGADPNNYNITYDYGHIDIISAASPIKPTTQGATISGSGGTSTTPIRDIGDNSDGDGSKF